MSTTRSEYSPGEEIANSVTHGLGVVAGIVALWLLVVPSAQMGDAWRIVAFSIYSASLILLYLASTLYHSIPAARARHWLKRIDHAAIYVFIAGTYTPISLVLLGDWVGWTLFGVVWGITICGIVLKFLFIDRFKRLFVAGYVVMGWVAIAAFPSLWNRLSAEGLAWLFGGGVAYTAGVIFYQWTSLRYSHAIWHLFVIAGSVCHFFLLYFHVLPRSA
ncbi:MAG TPA: hemolysin III family protein [Opitutaceae bacterium]|nr:hemolysin III family protein [Opitutaceae bacterium]